MTRLQQLYEEFGQSPWLDNLKRGWITSGELQRWVDRGVRGITSNPTIFAKAIEGAHDYDDQFRQLAKQGRTVEDSYWELVKQDIEDALSVLRPIADQSEGGDGFVSVEVAPQLAHDTDGTIQAATCTPSKTSTPSCVAANCLRSCARNFVAAGLLDRSISLLVRRSG